MERITENNNKIFIDNIEIKEEIFDEEMVDYKPCYRRDEIDNLYQWISETRSDSDKYLMKEDLHYLESIDDIWVWSNISTNEYIGSELEEYNEICDEFLKLNEQN